MGKRTCLSLALLAFSALANLRADAISDASAALKAAIETYAADPTPANEAAMAVARTDFDSAVADNFTDFYDTNHTINDSSTISPPDPTAIYVTDPATLTWEVSGDSAVSVDNSGAFAVAAGPGASAVFSGNSASYGSAILNTYDAVTTLSGASFESNSGGAVYNSGGTVTLVGASFSDNTNGDSGGAIAIAYDYDDTNADAVTLSGASFTNNSTGYGGGAIYNDHGTMTLVDASFTGNSDGSGFNGGGAIFNDGGTATLTSTTFEDNHTGSGFGGAIYNSDGGTITLTDASFEGNSTGSGDGGAIYNNGGTMTLTGASFEDNSAGSGYYGGAIYNNGGTMTLTGADFVGNHTAIGNGGAIFNAYDFLSHTGTVTLTGASFEDNTAGGNGGAIYNNYGTVTLTDASFEGNSTAGGDGGGAIYNFDGTVTALTGASFKDNTATNGYGGAIFNDSGTVTLAGASFEGNRSLSQRGGAISNNYGTVTLTDASFVNNSASEGGGAIFNYDDFNSGTVTLTDVTFEGNSTDTIGGAILNDSGTMTLTGASFEGNTANVFGGAIYNYNGDVTLTDASFTGNSANNAAGAIDNDAGTLTLAVTAGATSLFTGNNVSGTASSIHMGGGAATLNVSVAAGGTLDMRDPLGGIASGGTQTITQSGAGVWKLGGASAFTDNTSVAFTQSGGALYLYAEGEMANDIASTGDVAETVGAGSLSFTGSDSVFTVGADAVLAAGGTNSVTTAGAIDLQDGATLRGGTADDRAADSLLPTEGGVTSALTLTADGGITLEGLLTVSAVEADDTFTLDADLAGSSGSLEKTGEGVVILTGASAYDGATTVSDGVLLVNGSLVGSGVAVESGATLGGDGSLLTDVTVDGGTLAPGSESAGLLTIGGGLTLDSASTVVMELATLTSYDQIEITDGFTLGGTLRIDLLAGFSLGDEDSYIFQLFEAGTFSGDFGSLLVSDSRYTPAFNSSTGELTLTAVPEPSATGLLLAGAALLLALARQWSAASRGKTARGRRVDTELAAASLRGA